METHQHNPEFRFCPVCGGVLRSSMVNNRPLPVCASCHFVFYQDPKVVACSILEVDHRIVLLKRGINPQKGKWVLPGGYVDRGEAVKDAAIREFREECGLLTRVRRLFGVYSYTGQIPVVIIYIAQHVSGELIAGDETLEAGWFSENKIPWDNIAFRSTKEALEDYYKHINKGRR